MQHTCQFPIVHCCLLCCLWFYIFLSESIDYLQVIAFKYDMLSCLKTGRTFLLNTTFSAEELQDHLPNRMLAQLAKKNAKFYIIDATKIAQEIGMERRTGTAESLKPNLHDFNAIWA